jgi:hypothetical protein
MYKIIGADGKEYGPISAEVLRQWIAEGRANAMTYILVDGAAEWKSLGSLPEFSLFFAAAAQPGAPAVLTIACARKNNGFAVAGFVLGLVSLCFCCCYGLPFNLLGIVFSIIGLAQIRSNRDVYTGQGLAIAGLVLSGLSIFTYIALGLLGILSSQFNDFPRNVHRL